MKHGHCPRMKGSKLNAFETEVYRRALGIRYGERITNRKVFIRVGCEAMLEKSTRKRKLRYYGHVVRHASLEHTIMFGMMAGMKRQGGQKKQWIEDICTWASTATAPVPVAPNGRLKEKIDSNQFFQRNNQDRESRGHSKKLFQQRSRLNVRKYSFSQRVVGPWNKLPQQVIDAPSVNAFKNRYDSFIRRNMGI